MKAFQFISVKLCFGLIVGILIQYYFSQPPLLWLILASLGFVAVLFFYLQSKKSLGFGVGFAITIVATGGLLLALKQPQWQGNHFKNFSSDSGAYEVKLLYALKPTTYAKQYVAEVNHLNGKPCRGKVLINLPHQENVTINIDDELLFHAKVTPIAPPKKSVSIQLQKVLGKLGHNASSSANRADYCKATTRNKNTGWNCAAIQR